MTSASDEILKLTRKVAVYGYSANPERPSHWIAQYLQDQGYEVYRINPILTSNAKVRVFKNLDEVPVTVDLVDIFRAPQHVPDIVEESIRHGAKAIWLQPGAENLEAATTARQHGLLTVIGQCLYAVHRAKQEN